MLLRRDIITWRHGELSRKEATKIVDALDGFRYVAHLVLDLGWEPADRPRTRRPDSHPLCDRCARDQNPMNEGQRRKLMKLAKESGISRDARIALATAILGRPVSTWKPGTLTHREADRLLNALQGYHYMSHLLSVRSRGTSESR